MHANIRIDTIKIESSGSKIEWLKLSCSFQISIITISGIAEGATCSASLSGKRENALFPLRWMDLVYSAHYSSDWYHHTPYLLAHDTMMCFCGRSPVFLGVMHL